MGELALESIKFSFNIRFGNGSFIEILDRFKNPDLQKYLYEGFKLCPDCRYLVKTEKLFCPICGNKFRDRVRDKKRD